MCTSPWRYEVHMEAEYVRVKRITEIFGWFKATVHRKLSRKLIRGKKDGRITLVELKSVYDHVASLPDR